MQSSCGQRCVGIINGSFCYSTPYGPKRQEVWTLINSIVGITLFFQNKEKLKRGSIGQALKCLRAFSEVSKCYLYLSRYINHFHPCDKTTSQNKLNLDGFLWDDLKASVHVYLAALLLGP